MYIATYKNLLPPQIRILLTLPVQHRRAGVSSLNPSLDIISKGVDFGQRLHARVAHVMRGQHQGSLVHGLGEEQRVVIEVRVGGARRQVVQGGVQEAGYGKEIQ